MDCINRLKAMFDTISALERNNDNMSRINQEAQRMIRVLTILRVYIADCDEAYSDERAILPLFRQVFRVHTVHVDVTHKPTLYVTNYLGLEYRHVSLALRWSVYRAMLAQSAVMRE